MLPPFQIVALVATLALFAGCDHYPRDPEETLDRVQSGVMRVGVSHDPPFTVLESKISGREVALVRGFARRLGARVAWRSGGHAVLMRELEHHRLDMVVGGHAKDSPWVERVATSRAYRIADGHGHIVERVAALPPGENAWLMAFERHTKTPGARRMLEAP